MIAFLEASLVRPLGLVAVAWLILRVFRVQHPASRHAVWTTVLIGMLLLPIISVVGPRWTLAVLPVTDVAESRSPIAPPAVTTADPFVEPASPTVSQPASATSAAVPFEWPSSETLITGAYFVGVCVMAMYRLMGWILLRRVLSRSKKLRPACLRESSDVVTPAAVGVFLPSVILPSGWRRWDARTKRAVLAHEFAHLRRRDTLVAALGRVVTSVLWFHPVAWWVSRKTSELAELACDAVALERVGDPASYSRVLVEFARAVNQSGQRIALPGLAIASGSRMNDRVDQVFEMSTGTMRRLARPRVWLATGVPVMCLVATVMLGARAPQQPEAAAQAASALAPKFDVVSIKLCPGLDVVRPPGSGRGANPNAPQISPGYVHWDCVTLAGLIDQAWAGGGNGPRGNGLLNVLDRPREDSPKRVRGGPSWVHEERFTIEVKMSGDTTELTGAGRFVQVRDAMLPALRAMIEDRFQLKFRKATEQQSMYAMSVAKGGLKITQTAPQDCWPRPIGLGRGQVATPPPGFEGTPECGINVHGMVDRGVLQQEITHANLTDFARYLSSQMDRYVLDKTGVLGRFSFKFEYLPDDTTPGGRQVDLNPGFMIVNGVRVPEPPPPPARTDGKNIFKALEALGLHLEATKGPAEYLQIESVQRPKPNESIAIAVEPPDSTAHSGPNADLQERASTEKKQDTFDVVSIKPCADVSTAQTGRGAGPNLAQTSPGHVFWACVTLASLIDQAYAGWDFPLLNMPDRPLTLEVPGFPRGASAGDDGPKRVRGGPSWMYSERFTIEATASADVINPPAGAVNLLRLPPAMNRALRAMLADRFKLNVRRETEQRPMYALSVAKEGLKIKSRGPDDCVVPPDVRPAGTERPRADGFWEGKWMCGIFGTAPRAWLSRIAAGESIATLRDLPGPNRRTDYRGVTLQTVTQRLANEMDRFVLDKTGVSGEFLFALEFRTNENMRGGGISLVDRSTGPATTDAPKATEGRGDTIFEALASVGLKLEPTMGPAEYLVIDRAERPSPDHLAPQRGQNAGLPRRSLGGGGSR